MMPFQIERPPSMPAWLCARSDGEHYGRLLAFTFPQGVDGPTQAESFIDQNPEISSQLTLWDRAGSRVFRGGLLALPMDQSILYVKPIYLVSEANSVPRLTRVIIVNEGRAVMAPTLGQALTALVQSDQRPPEAGTIVVTGPSAGGPTPVRPEGTETAPPSTNVQSRAPGARVGGSVPQLIQQANQAFEAATDAQRRGDWATYGAQLQRLQSALRELQRQTGAAQ